MLAEREVLKAPFADFNLRDDTFGPVPVRRLGVEGGGEQDDGTACLRSERLQPGEKVLTHEQSPRPEPRFQAVLQLAPAFHHKKTLLPPRLGFFLQQEQILEFRVLGRCDRFCPQNFSGFIVGKNSTSWMASFPVMNIVRRSMPMPMPEVGGMPYSSARTKS